MFLPYIEFNNLKDALEDVEFLKWAHLILLEYIKNGEINRYFETRWNSIYDKFKELHHIE